MIDFSGIKDFIMTPEFLGQGAAQIPKVAISMFTTELGNKVINSLIGLIGNIANEWKMPSGKYKDILRSMFTNLMWSFTDPTMNQMRELKRNADDLVAGITSKRFNTSFGAIFEEPQTIINTIKSSISGLNLGKGLGKGFSNILGSGATSAGKGFLSKDRMIRTISPDIVSQYSANSLGKPLDVNDLTDY